MSCKSDDSFQARPGWTCLKCLKAVIKRARHTPAPNVQRKISDDGQRNCPKHVEFLDRNIFGKIILSVGFIKRRFVTIHGHMNVKDKLVLCFKLQARPPA